MFCVECGKEGTIYKNGVCISCYLKNNKFTSGPAIIDIDICPKCSSFKYKNTWLQQSFDDVLKRHVRDHFHISRELKKVTIELECEEKDKIIPCRVRISGFIDDHEITEHHEIQVRLKRNTCDICSKQFGGYFEAILQIRTEKRKASKEELQSIREDVEKHIENLQSQGNRGLFLTDLAEEPGGFDFYLSEKGAALTIAKKIQERYGGELKQSAKNIGMKDSRQVYRITYLVRLPAYQTGDIIQYHGTYFLISSIIGDKVHCLNLSDWSERTVKGKDLQNAQIIKGKECIQEMIVICQTDSEVQLMNPKTYKTIEIHKPKKILLKQPTVKIIQINDQTFLYPNLLKEKKKG